MKSTICKIAISVILSCFILFPLSAKQLFVSPEGDDSADGSSSGNAFKTLSKAVDAAEEGDEIVLLGIIDKFITATLIIRTIKVSKFWIKD